MSTGGVVVHAHIQGCTAMQGWCCRVLVAGQEWCPPSWACYHCNVLLSAPQPQGVKGWECIAVQELLIQEPDRALIYSFWRLPLLWLAFVLVRALCICGLNPIFRLAGARELPPAPS